VKPKVFKMGGSWIWECRNGHGGLGVGGYFNAERWVAPWACAYSRAVDHAERYHDTKQLGEIVGDL